jgi:hypothetical protein
MSVRLPVCLSACIRTAPTDRFPWNLILGTFMKICGENPNLVKIRQKWRPKYIVLLPATLNRHKSALSVWNVIRLLGYSTRHEDYANTLPCYVTGAHLLPGCSLSKPPKLKFEKDRFCMYCDMRSFTWFTPQQKSATEIAWWLAH